MLAALAQHGVDVGGIEFPSDARPGLRAVARGVPRDCWSAATWNTDPTRRRLRRRLLEDVLEHLVSRRVPIFVRKIHDELAPGGCLVTLTRTGTSRPSDVTRCFRPAPHDGRRFSSQGIHAPRNDRRAAGRRLRPSRTRCFVTRGRIVVCGQGLAGVKTLVRTGLERLPYKLTNLLCPASA